MFRIIYYLVMTGTIMVIITGLFFIIRAKTTRDIHFFGITAIIIAFFLGFFVFAPNNLSITELIVSMIIVSILDLTMVFVFIVKSPPAINKLRRMMKLSIKK